MTITEKLNNKLNYMRENKDKTIEDIKSRDKHIGSFVSADSIKDIERDSFHFLFEGNGYIAKYYIATYTESSGESIGQLYEVVNYEDIPVDELEVKKYAQKLFIDKDILEAKATQ